AVSSLSRITARSPLASTLLYTTSPPLAETTVPCRPSASWSTAITSVFFSVVRVALDAERMSLPISSGAAISAQRLKCARYSASVIPPLPTSSMSGSFQCPGPANWARSSLVCTREIMLDQLSLMSPVVRHRLPTSAPHSQTLGGPVRPHSQMLYTIGRPVLASASRIAV